MQILFPNILFPEYSFFSKDKLNDKKRAVNVE